MPKNRPYDVSHYKISPRIDVTKSVFEGSVVIDFKALRATRVLELDSVDLAISKVSLVSDGKSLRYSLDSKNGLLTIELPQVLGPDQAQSVQIDYSGPIGSQHEGLFRVDDPYNHQRPPLYFTHFEPLFARKFFPSNDEPYDKATTEVIAEVNEPQYSILSNGQKVSDEVYKDQNGISWRKARWVMEKPHSSYLVNLAVGEFGNLSDNLSGVPLNIYVAPDKTKDVALALDVLKGSLRFFEDFYKVPYPWPAYAMVGIPSFQWGGMENTTLTSMRESALTIEDSSSVLQKYRIATVVTHELAHQWFGDYVTMRWWDDVWLNEAFASYMEVLAVEFLSAPGLWSKDLATIETTLDVWEGYFRQEDGPRSHPIVTNELPSPEDAFDSINYTKGQQVLRMLDFYIGRDAFQKGVASYMKEFAYANATYKDFFASMEKASGADLSGFVNSWLLNRGYPIVTIKKKWVAKTNTLELTLTQRPNHKEDKTLFDFKLPISFSKIAEDAFYETQVIHCKEKTHQFTVKLPAKPDWVSVNPGGVALARFEMPNTTELEWSRQALEDPDITARISALFYLADPWINRDAKQLGKLTQLAKATLEQALRKDPSPFVRWALLGKLADSKWPRYPDTLVAAIYQNAENPKKLSSKEDMGVFLVRTRAIGLLGKHYYPKGMELVSRLAQDKNLPIDYVGAVAGALARRGDDESRKKLKAMIQTHKDRGYPFQKYILTAFGAIANVKAADDIAEIVKNPEFANNEVIGGIFWRLHNNEVVRTSKEGTSFIRDFVLHNTTFNDQMKSNLLSVLEEVKNNNAKLAAQAIAKESSSQRLRDLAQKILDKNFPLKK